MTFEKKVLKMFLKRRLVSTVRKGSLDVSRSVFLFGKETYVTTLDICR